MSIVWVILGFILLVIGGEYLVRSSIALSFKLNLSKMIIGLTVVSFATSAPELLVSLNAALNGSPAIAINNVVGSNIANLGLVLGITILFSPISISKSVYRKEWPIMMFSAIYFLIVIVDGTISKIEGGILVCFLVMTISALIKLRDKSEVELENSNEDSLFKSLFILFFGGLFLYYGSEWFIDGAIMLANSFGISERIIGITVVSVGTSIPELVTSLVAVFNKEKSISLGNLLGSNIFNVFAVLGITSLVTPLTVLDQSIINYDIYVMLFFAAIILPLIFFPKKLVLGRKEGIIILLFYTLYVYQLLIN